MAYTKLNSAIQRGFVQSDSVTTADTTVHVTFSSTFASTPTVVIGLSGASYNRRVHTANESTTGFDAVFALNSGSSSAWCGASWVAIA